MRVENAQRSRASVDVVELHVCLPDHGAPRGPDLAAGPRASPTAWGWDCSRQAITQLAQALFADGAADRIVVAGMPKLRAAMHLDTVFTFADRDLATIHPGTA